MNNFSRVLYILILMSSAHMLKAYEFDFSNWTGMPLVLMFERESALSKDFQIVMPGEMVKHVWQGTEGGQCIRNTIKWAVWRGSNSEYKKWASDRVRIPSEKQRDFSDRYLTFYAWNDLPITMITNNVFNEIKKQASKLVKGITQGSDAFPELIEASADLAKISLCKSRVFSIIDTGKKHPKTKNKLLKATTVEGE